RVRAVRRAGADCVRLSRRALAVSVVVPDQPARRRTRGIAEVEGPPVMSEEQRPPIDDKPPAVVEEPVAAPARQEDPMELPGEEETPGRRGRGGARPKSGTRMTVVFVVILLAGALLALYAWDLPPFHSAVQTTDNAFVRGQTTVIAPQVSGYVTKVYVHDFE